MSKIVLHFTTIHQLWGFAKKVAAVDLEIHTNERILICDCQEEDLKLLQEYEGVIVMKNEYSFSQKA